MYWSLLHWLLYQLVQRYGSYINKPIIFRSLIDEKHLCSLKMRSMTMQLNMKYSPISHNEPTSAHHHISKNIIALKFWEFLQHLILNLPLSVYKFDFWHVLTAYSKWLKRVSVVAVLVGRQVIRAAESIEWRYTSVETMGANVTIKTTPHLWTCLYRFSHSSSKAHMEKHSWNSTDKDLAFIRIIHIRDLLYTYIHTYVYAYVSWVNNTLVWLGVGNALL